MGELEIYSLNESKEPAEPGALVATVSRPPLGEHHQHFVPPLLFLFVRVAAMPSPKKTAPPCIALFKSRQKARPVHFVPFVRHVQYFPVIR